MDENVKFALAEFAGLVGFELMVVFGAVVSIVKLRLGPVSVLFALSFPRMWTV